MGLITKKVKVRWHVNNRKHYEKIGYVFTKYGEVFYADILDLPKCSKIIIKYECDNCGRIFKCSYAAYNRNKKEDGKKYCSDCSRKLFSIAKLKQRVLAKSISFEEWCINNHREDILNRWDYDKNHCTPKDVSYGSSELHWFKCDKHEYHHSELNMISGIVYGNYHKGFLRCRQCNSIAQYIIDNYGDLNKVWSDKNGDLDPWSVSIGSDKKVWLKCTKTDYHDDYNTISASFTTGHGCPYCSGRKTHPKDSLGQFIIDNFGEEFLWKIWSDKNDKTPFEFAPYSSKKVWFKCQKKDYHDSYLITCAQFTNGTRCPYCSGRKAHPKDSLGQYIINNYGEEFLWKIWSDKNDKTPFEFTPRSNKKVWMECPDKKHESFKRSCFLSTLAEYRCPKCSKNRRKSYIEEKTKTYLEDLGYDVKTECDCTLIPINPKTKQYLPFDNEIILENGVHLIIEVHGAQHYEYKSYKSLSNVSEEQAKQGFHYRQLKDRYKRMFCKKCGYEYLELSYKCFRNDKYKEIIDNKINRILNKTQTHIDTDIWFECLMIDNVAERMRKLSTQKNTK